MAKNVVVCCDGTANELATDHTNVVKLFRVLENDQSRQVAFYHPGLGTMEAIGALTSVSRKVTKFLGLAFGYGLERDVCDAYGFLMQQGERRRENRAWRITRKPAPMKKRPKGESTCHQGGALALPCIGR